MRSVVLWLALCGCGAPAVAPPVAPDVDAAPHEPAPLIGETTRQRVLSTHRDWQRAFDAATPDAESAQKLASVPPGARVDVYFGTWCSDSRAELSRLWKALDQVGPVPFELRWIGVDRQKHAPEVNDALELRRVPTFVVLRDGHEVGRIIEHAPRGIETELREQLER